MTSIISIAGLTVGASSLAIVLVARKLIIMIDRLVSRIERLDATIKDSKAAIGGVTDALAEKRAKPADGKED